VHDCLGFQARLFADNLSPSATFDPGAFGSCHRREWLRQAAGAESIHTAVRVAPDLPVSVMQSKARERQGLPSLHEARPDTCFPRRALAALSSIISNYRR
jgi:hypothetical protein